MVVENLGNIITISLVLLGLASIPFLSHTVTMSAVDNYNEGLGPILGEENISSTDAKHFPGNSEEVFGPDKFHYHASTAFGEFSIKVENGDNLIIVEKLSNNGIVFTSENINNGTALREIWTLKTNNFTLTSEKYYSSVKETFTSPDGTCYKEIKMGQVSESCTGQLDKIESKWEDAKEMMNDYAEKVRKASESIDIPNIQSS